MLYEVITVAILQHQDGPEAMTIQYAEDGVNFEIMGSITNFPEAPGLFRPNTPSSLPIDGVKWGLCHVLNWNYGPQGWMNLRRFDLVAEEPVISFVNRITSYNVCYTKLLRGLPIKVGG